jgi:hypothetical protein
MYPPPARLQPAVYGRLVIGVLSALPIVNLGNCFCCMWVIGGGALAAYLLQQNHPYPISAADGALVGLLAGVIGGVLSGILSIPLHVVTGPMQQQILQRVLSNADMPAETRAMLENMNTSARSGAMAVIGIFFSACIDLVFGMLGGLLGVALFKKKDVPPPPGTTEILPPPA